MSDRLTVDIQAEDLAASNRQTQQLIRIIADQAPTVTADRRKQDIATLDGGTTLALAFASPVIVELAKALQVFLTRYHTSKITIRDESGTIIAENLSAANAEGVLSEWTRSRHVSRTP